MCVATKRNALTKETAGGKREEMPPVGKFQTTVDRCGAEKATPKDQRAVSLPIPTFCLAPQTQQSR